MIFIQVIKNLGLHKSRIGSNIHQCLGLECRQRMVSVCSRVTSIFIVKFPPLEHNTPNHL